MTTEAQTYDDEILFSWVCPYCRCDAKGIASAMVRSDYDAKSRFFTHRCAFCNDIYQLDPVALLKCKTTISENANPDRGE